MLHKNLAIEIVEDKATGTYTVIVNGEVQLECLTENEVGELTIADIQEATLI